MVTNIQLLNVELLKTLLNKTLNMMNLILPHYLMVLFT